MMFTSSRKKRSSPVVVAIVVPATVIAIMSRGRYRFLLHTITQISISKTAKGKQTPKPPATTIHPLLE